LWPVITGGLPPYTYNWNPSGSTADTLHGACYQTYTVTVTDSRHCTTTATINILIPGTTDTTVLTTGIKGLSNAGSELKIYPNPASQQLNIVLPEAARNSSVEIYNLLGKKIWMNPSPISATFLNVDLTGFEEGSYFLKVISASEQRVRKFTVIH
jgi:hypothetical protein